MSASWACPSVRLLFISSWNCVICLPVICQKWRFYRQIFWKSDTQTCIEYFPIFNFTALVLSKQRATRTKLEALVPHSFLSHSHILILCLCVCACMLHSLTMLCFRQGSECCKQLVALSAPVKSVMGYVFKFKLKQRPVSWANLKQSCYDPGFSDAE